MSHRRLARPHRVRPLALAAGIALALGVTAAPAAAQEGPEAPVLSLFAAIEDKRFEDTAGSFCPAFAGQAAQFDMASAMAGSLPSGIDPQVAEDALVFAVSGPAGEGEPVITVVSEDADGTRLSVEGTLQVSLDPVGAEPFVRAIVEATLAAQGMELTEENVAAFTTLLGGQVVGQVAFNEPISAQLVVTQGADGSWLICSPLSEEAPSSSPSEPPA
jgi:hypothetical protein